MLCSQDGPYLCSRLPPLCCAPGKIFLTRCLQQYTRSLRLIFRSPRRLSLSLCSWQSKVRTTDFCGQSGDLFRWRSGYKSKGVPSLGECGFSVDHSFLRFLSFLLTGQFFNILHPQCSLEVKFLDMHPEG